MANQLLSHSVIELKYENVFICLRYFVYREDDVVSNEESDHLDISYFWHQKLANYFHSMPDCSRKYEVSVVKGLISVATVFHCLLQSVNIHFCAALLLLFV